jgi:hypothetical protein
VIIDANDPLLRIFTAEGLTTLQQNETWIPEILAPDSAAVTSRHLAELQRLGVVRTDADGPRASHARPAPVLPLFTARDAEGSYQ